MKITVIVPVYQPDERFLRLLQSLAEQTVQFRVMVIDSGNSEAFYQAYLRPLGAVVQHIEARMFDHGATRQMGIVMNPDADVYVFLTQDAILAAQDAIGRLAGAFANPKIGCAYGRQLPHKNAGIFAAGARAFNYPSESYIRSYGDKERYGIRTAFVLVKHFCNSTTYIFKNDIELHKESDNYCMNVACHGCTSHRQILQ